MFTSGSWKQNVFMITLSAIPILAWSNLFITWYKLRKKYKADKLHDERHECVVMYANGRITGWPSNIPNAIKNPYEPLLYFINTANQSLDVAVMILGVKEIASALIFAHERGVKVRIILDFNYNQKTYSNELKRADISVVYYVPCGSSSIFHHKYVLKDYTKGNGYVCMGSLNWSMSAFRYNYENIVFTTSPTVVEQVHAAFEEDWKYIHELTLNSSYVRAKLNGVI